MTTLHSKKSSRRLPLRLGFLLIPLAVACLVFSPTAQAGSATWRLNPASGDWNTATNWNPITVPNGSSDVAGFSLSNRKAVSISQVTTVAQITFNSGASAFTISSRMEGSAAQVLGAGIAGVRARLRVTPSSLTMAARSAAHPVGSRNFLIRRPVAMPHSQTMAVPPAARRGRKRYLF